LTTATYWRPSGRNIHRLAKSTEEDEWGVSPEKEYEIKLEREAYIELLKARRDRDVPVRRSGQELKKTMPEETGEDIVESEEAKDASVEVATAEDESAVANEVLDSESDVPADESPKPFEDPCVEKALEYFKSILANDESGLKKAA
jgi:carboxyl-terminal processing protease